ncbi:nuclear transport factor 2 family protein [Lewinella sp. W8]|uniref:nuclear transport factor 2 family protein n=1 Tax=Lewinella sp. W8 TaxID=2528208 RepID=UPI001068294F|nr:nuclear transport factor 2 family protein [Lewinella sp. W8]MTB51755.1 hypothetical protein [Lewinella sp. W8]
MTRIFLAFATLFTFGNLAAQNAQDYAGVQQAVRYYLDGGTNNDFATLEKAFHPEASMQFINGEGEHVSVNAVEFFRKGMKPGPPSKRQTRVSSIEINGNAASARLEIDYPTFRFIDYMNLLKIDGEWKIVSKIFFREMRPKQE